MKKIKLFSIAMSMMLFATACSMSTIESSTDLSTSTVENISQEYTTREMPDVNPDKTFQNTAEFVPVVEWQKILRLHEYSNFAFKTKTGQVYWASVLLESDSVSPYKTIYLVVHDTKSIVYQNRFPVRIWHHKTKTSYIAITPTFQEERPDTWAFPVDSKLDKPAIVFINGRGSLEDYLKIPTTTQFAIAPGPKYYTYVKSDRSAVDTVFSSHLITPLFNRALCISGSSGSWLQFQYLKGYWFQYKVYQLPTNGYTYKILYRVLYNNAVVKEGSQFVSAYMTLDRHESEGAIKFTQPFPGIDSKFIWLNIFRKPAKGTRGKIGSSASFLSSNFEILKMKNPPTRSQEQRLLQISH